MSAIDPCLYMKKNMMCVIYVDDTFFAGTNQAMIDEKVRQI